jgi:hypothetical protein
MIQNQPVRHVVTSSPPRSTASSITIVPKTAKSVPVELNSSSSTSSVLHLTTAIDDDDDEELFSTYRRKIPIAQVKKIYRKFGMFFK